MLGNFHTATEIRILLGHTDGICDPSKAGLLISDFALSTLMTRMLRGDTKKQVEVSLAGDAGSRHILKAQQGFIEEVITEGGEVTRLWHMESGKLRSTTRIGERLIVVSSPTYIGNGSSAWTYTESSGSGLVIKYTSRVDYTNKAEPKTETIYDALSGDREVWNYCMYGQKDVVIRVTYSDIEYVQVCRKDLISIKKGGDTAWGELDIHRLAAPEPQSIFDGLVSRIHYQNQTDDTDNLDINFEWK